MPSIPFAPRFAITRGPSARAGARYSRSRTGIEFATNTGVPAGRLRAIIHAAFASKTPLSFSSAPSITPRAPADDARVVYSQHVYEPTNPADPLSPSGAFQGCARENYVGPNYVRNAGNPTTYYTDAYGNASGSGQTQDAAHPIAQTVFAGNDTDNYIYKKTGNVCGGGIHAPN